MSDKKNENGSIKKLNLRRESVRDLKVRSGVQTGGPTNLGVGGVQPPGSILPGISTRPPNGSFLTA
jgi:hypothetical protein